MTDDLLLKLREVLAFDENEVTEWFKSHFGDNHYGHETARMQMIGAAKLHARRAKVDEALVECALALESITNGLLAGISPYNAQVDKAFYALKALEAAVDKLEG